MADDRTKVTQLPLSENLDNDDLLYVVEDSVSKKAEVGYLREVFVGDVDSAPSQGSTNLVQSGGVYTALASKADASAIPTDLADLAEDSTHRLVTDTEKSTWNAKQSALTFDDVPTDGSNNPVKSNGIYDALATKANTSDVPTALADLSDDSTHRVVTDTEKSTWNAKSDFSGSYNDLTDTPTIPSDAGDIDYDNTESGLTADDVQGAIDEINGNIVDVEANPSGTATGELETIKVGSTIYDIVGGEKVYGEASGAIASFSDGSANPLADLKIAINPVQAGSGDPSPSNPRIISGWTGVEIHVADGATPHIIDNIVNISWQTEAGTVYGGYVDWKNRKVVIDSLTYTVTGDEIFTTTGAGQHAIITPSIATLKIDNTEDNNHPSYCVCEFAKNMSYTALNVSGTTDGIAIGTTYILVGSEQYGNWNSLIGKKIVYKTTKPIEYTLSSVPNIRSILGANNIWADTGNINYCKYQRDLNLCINDIISRIEALEQ